MTELVVTAYGPVEDFYGDLSCPVLVLVGAESSVVYDTRNEDRQLAACRLRELHPDFDVRIPKAGHDSSPKF